MTLQLEHFTTESYPSAQRAQAWREALHKHRLSPEPAGASGPLHGTLLAGRSARGMELMRIASSAQTLARRSDDRQAIWLTLHQAGEATLFDGRQQVEVQPGDIVYGPAHATPGLRFGSSFRQFLVQLPGEGLNARLLAPHGLQVGRLSGRHGLGRLFAGMLEALSASFDTLDEADIAPVERTLSEFVASSLVKTAAGVSPASASHAALLHRVQQFIEGRLSDTDLSLAVLARHERVSERLLQKLFEGSGQTFATYLRARRLERCRADLVDRNWGHLSISDICFRWGFNDAAHFSRSFRDQYQVSPRAYRQQASEASQQSMRRALQRGWPAGYREPVDETAERSPRGPTQAEPSGAGEANADTASHAVTAADTDTPDRPGSTTRIGRHHHLPAHDKTVHWGFFSRELAPVLRVDSGDTVTIETLTQHAYDDHDRMIKGDSAAESVFHWTATQKNVDRRGAGPTDASIYGRGSGEGFGVHICTGPIHVRGAEPGDVLEVRILDVLPRPSANPRYEGRAFGSNAATWWGFHYDDLLTEPKPREVVTIFEIGGGGSGLSGCAVGPAGGACAHAVYNFRWTPQRDPSGVLHPTIDYPGVPVDRESIVENHGVLRDVHIPTRPHFGVIAVAPVESGLVDSIPPAYFGGNLDNWRVAKGASVYLRVGVEGALLSVGDPHASQGDSELCGTAIECSLTGVFQLVLHKADTLTDQPFADISYPLIETPTEWVLHGFSHPDYLQEFGAQARSEIYTQSSLDLAMRDAFRKARRFLMTAQGLSEDEAIALMSVAVDFGVTQVVDGNWGVHAVIRKSMFRARQAGTNVASKAAPTWRDAR